MGRVLLDINNYPHVSRLCNPFSEKVIRRLLTAIASWNSDFAKRGGLAIRICSFLGEKLIFCFFPQNLRIFPEISVKSSAILRGTRTSWTGVDCLLRFLHFYHYVGLLEKACPAASRRKVAGYSRETSPQKCALRPRADNMAALIRQARWASFSLRA